MSKELNDRYQHLKSRFEELSKVFSDPKRQLRLGELESAVMEENFWQDGAKARVIMRELDALRRDREIVSVMRTQLGDMQDFLALDDESYLGEITAQMDSLDAKLEELHEERLFSGRYDRNDALLAIHSGTGGVDAQDWAQMLERMYVRYVGSKGWEGRILEETFGEEAGLKSMSMEVIGEKAYGYLKAEHGVHRLVRLSPFNAKNSRETSFALVEVMPLVEGSSDVVIVEKDLKIEVFRARGHGGQGVNTTDSAVRVTHLPSGIVVSCQNERSQLQNKQNVMKILQARLQRKVDLERQDELEKTKGIYKQGTWGNQIRSYVLQPYTMVKDHRTDYEESNTTKVLGGELDNFILAYLKKSIQDQT